MAEEENISKSGGHGGDAPKLILTDNPDGISSKLTADASKTEDHTALVDGNVSDADETDPVLSLDDMLNEQKELESNAAAVLGGVDETQCTYPGGYLKRQPLYACVTCSPCLALQPAGICLACSLTCHDGHELIELYTKRSFRCDCGNEKFDIKCKLCPEKDVLNELNQYSQNFQGLYCTCQRPYPDPDNDDDDTMVQCAVCEDWFHSKHLKVDSLPDEFDEMICFRCAESLPFLSVYQDNEEGRGITDGNVSQSQDCKTKSEEKDSEIENDVDVTTTPKPKEACMLLQYAADRDFSDLQPRSSFFKDGWREKLCRCKNCLDTYRTKSCLFLLDNEDTIAFYEEQGLERFATQPTADELAAKFLQKFPRVQQIELAEGYRELKEGLADFLRNFQGSGKKVVTVEDVNSFFEDFHAKKRRRIDAPPDFCR